MNELVKALERFIVRDLIYIIGGASVILSILYFFDKLYTFQECTSILKLEKAAKIILYVLGIGLAYVIAYAIQEFFSLFPPFWLPPLTRTALYSKDKPHNFIIRLYERYIHEDWRQPEAFYEDEASVAINKDASENYMADLERRAYHMQICTTFGSCGIVSGILLLIKSFGCKLSIVAPFIVILFSIFLLLLGRVKLAQLTQFVSALYSNIKEQKEEKKPKQNKA